MTNGTVMMRSLSNELSSSSESNSVMKIVSTSPAPHLPLDTSSRIAVNDDGRALSFILFSLFLTLSLSHSQSLD
jgi:hypothetical protein